MIILNLKNPFIFRFLISYYIRVYITNQPFYINFKYFYSVFLEKEIISQIKNRDIIDGGAYVGDSALVFSELGPSRIFSFEPVDSLFEKLNETIILNNFWFIR